MFRENVLFYFSPIFVYLQVPDVLRRDRAPDSFAAVERVFFRQRSVKGVRAETGLQFQHD